MLPMLVLHSETSSADTSGASATAPCGTTWFEDSSGTDALSRN
jgi:hypothetical protein